MSLRKAYNRRRDRVLLPVAKSLEAHIEKLLKTTKRIDRICARAKETESFLRKAQNKSKNGALKYAEPLNEILDQIGVRIVVFYPQDVDLVSSVISDYFMAIETKELAPEFEYEFGYIGRHFILSIPTELIPEDADEDLLPQHFELQIKTMFQHAWSEASHDLAYKPGHGALDSEQLRLIAYAAAQAWGADRIFRDISDGRIFQNIGKI